MTATFAIVKRLLASNKISFIITVLAMLCATSSGDVVLSNGNYAWLLAVLTPFFFVFYDFDGNELRKFRSEESATMYNNTIYVELGIANNIIYYNEVSFNSTGIELIQITD